MPLKGISVRLKRQREFDWISESLGLNCQKGHILEVTPLFSFPLGHKNPLAEPQNCLLCKKFYIWATNPAKGELSYNPNQHIIRDIRS